MLKIKINIVRLKIQTFEEWGLIGIAKDNLKEKDLIRSFYEK
jgi:hypothetical protein